MDDTEKPGNEERFWTPTILLLLGINAFFLILIMVGILLVAGFYVDEVGAWLSRVFNV